tara:strand:- start:130688 stop:132448 length:1761 start_codon:yes stop_codon:yes gene_type:complete
MKSIRKLAIIGIGPRGLFAFENLLINLYKRNSLQKIQLLLFEETKNLGNGPVYEIQQIQSNWINISERILDLEERESFNFQQIQIPSFPSFHEWSKKNHAPFSKELPDLYPPRNYVGMYLNQRFDSLFEPLKKSNIISLVIQRVDRIEMKDHELILQTNQNELHTVDEILLTIGHQPTRLSNQIKKWQSFAEKHNHIQLIIAPYPIDLFLQMEQIKPKNTVALRGFGLAMIDVARAIAEKFGAFVTQDNASKSLYYKSDFNLKNLIVPFSLDGLPPSPKPLNAQIDQWFTPTEKELLVFEQILGNTEKQKKARGISFLIDEIVPVIAKIYRSLPLFAGKGEITLPEIEEVTTAWLNDSNYEHLTITARQQPTEKIMQDFVQMAIGKGTVSLDFCIGQVWRHCQPSIYKALSFNECSKEVFAEIINLDERMKRYSYGPPVESIQQLLALVEAEVMNLTFVNDPSINLTKKGWILRAEDVSITAQTMINTVLDSPRLESVSSPIIKNLLSNDLIQAVHDDLGVYTDSNGYVVSKKKNEILPIALLGRLAKGTIIGVDAILECFGDRPKQWAFKAAERHTDWLISNTCD